MAITVTSLSATCPHAEGTARHAKWKVLRVGITAAEAHKLEPLCDLTYLRKMAKRGHLTLAEQGAVAAPAKPAAKAAAPAKPAKAAAPAKPAKAAAPAKPAKAAAPAKPAKKTATA